MHGERHETGIREKDFIEAACRRIAVVRSLDVFHQTRANLGKLRDEIVRLLASLRRARKLALSFFLGLVAKARGDLRRQLFVERG